MPVGDVVVGAVDVSGGLAHVERADQGHEEHHVAGQGKGDCEAVAIEKFARAAPARLTIFPVVAFASTTGWPPVDGGFTADTGVAALRLDLS